MSPDSREEMSDPLLIADRFSGTFSTDDQYRIMFNSAREAVVEYLRSSEDRKVCGVGLMRNGRSPVDSLHLIVLGSVAEEQWEEVVENIRSIMAAFDEERAWIIPIVLLRGGVQYA